MPIRSKAAAAVALAAAVTAASSLPALAEARQADAPNIVEVVLDVSGDAGFDHQGRDYDLLREALVATGLVDAVANTDGITVFAPNDRAFIRLARDLGYEGRDEAGAFAFLATATGFESAENPGLLDDVLLYHVAPGLIRSGNLADGPVETLLGETFTPDGLNLQDNDPNADDPKVRTPFDLEAANGVIHTIDRVLRPIDLPPTAPASAVDLVITASGNAGFDTDKWDFDLLREALVATGLVDAVANTQDITVFAPNDRAFIRLARNLGYEGHDEAGVFAFLATATGFESAENPGLLDDVLLYHVAPGAQTLAELHGNQIETLLGTSVSIDGRRIVDGDPNATNAWIRKPQSNLSAGTTVMHTISRVLRPIDLPPTAPASAVDLVITASGNAGFDTDKWDFDLLREALVATGLVDAVANTQDITVFAPNDRAFIRLARNLGYEGHDEAGVFAFLATATGFESAENPGLLDDVLLYHVAPGAQTLAELHGNQIETLLGTSVSIDGRRIVDGDPNATNAWIRKPQSNLSAGTTVMHTISRVLRPIDL